MNDLRKAALAVVHAWDTDGPVSTMEDLRAALAQPEIIPGATPMAEYAAKSAAVPGRAEALKQAGYTRRPRQLPGEDEPVAHRIFDGEGGYVFVDGEPNEFEVEWSARYRRKYEPLYTAPPQRQPLTDDLARATSQCNAWWVTKCKEMLDSERETFVAIINDNTDGDGICCADDLLAAIRTHGSPQPDESFCDTHCTWLNHHPYCEFRKVTDEP